MATLHLLYAQYPSFYIRIWVGRCNDINSFILISKYTDCTPFKILYMAVVNKYENSNDYLLVGLEMVIF
jgi:hypothetical protein